MSSRIYTWVFRAPGERYVRSWILQRQSTEIRIRSGRAGREKQTESYKVRSKRAATDHCAELRRQREAEGWILAASEAKEESGYSRDYSCVPVHGAVLSQPGDMFTFSHPFLPRKKRVVDLVSAVRAGDADAVRGYLESGADPDQRHEGISMLTVAANYDHLEVMNLLLDAGASVSPRGEPPLETAAARGREYALCRLIEAGASPQAMASALHSALSVWRPRIAELLIELEADVNAFDKRGLYRPLDYVLARGDHAMMRRLLERGARIGGARKASSPPVKTFRMDDLSDAIDDGDLDRVRQLVDEGVLSERERYLGSNPLEWAAGEGRVEIVRLLLEARADPVAGPVHAAARDNHLEVAKLFARVRRFGRRHGRGGDHAVDFRGLCRLFGHGPVAGRVRGRR